MQKELQKKIVQGIVALVLIIYLVLAVQLILPDKTEYISIDYYVKDARDIVVDTNIEKVAKEAGIYNPQRQYTPFTFATEKKEVIPGVEETAKTLKVGEEKIAVIPPEQAYGPVNYSWFKEIQKETNVPIMHQMHIKEFIALTGKEPIEGQLVTIDPFGWKMLVKEVKEFDVIVENALKVGDKVTLSGTSWESQVTKKTDEHIVLRQNPKLHDQMVTADGNAEFNYRVVKVTKDSFSVDANHPLAGQTLTFYMKIVNKERR